MIKTLIGIMSCTNNSSNSHRDVTGTVETIQDTNHLITVSVMVPDINTADIDPMKKRN